MDSSGKNKKSLLGMTISKLSQQALHQNLMNHPHILHQTKEETGQLLQKNKLFQEIYENESDEVVQININFGR